MKDFDRVLFGVSEWLVKCVSCCLKPLWFCGNKVSSSSETRLIDVGAAHAHGEPRRKLNRIKTSKYTLLLFLPKNLAEQFRRVVNFYFLLVTVVAIVIDSPVSPFTSITPLSFMVLVTAVKQGYEDWLRHRADNRVNNRIVEIIDKGVIKEVRNSSIAPGTLVRVKRGREVPADLVLLCSAGEKGKCYVTTANLDGETNLKTLRMPPPLVGFTPDILPQGIKIEVPSPVPDLYTFYGRVDIPGYDSMALSTDNLMLRGSRVKNTEWAIGCAVYTGEETKLALNSKYTSNKFSSCELAVNGFLLILVIILAIEITGSLLAKLILEKNNPEHQVYIGQYGKAIANDLFSFILLYYYIIPMSLYVTIELYKFIGALFIGWDEQLRCDETGRPAIANTSDLNEELGQVEVLFSDKTGTLTKNLMVFKACSVRGKVYEEREGSLYHVDLFEHPVDTRQTDIKFFFTILALCHSVQISNEDKRRLTAKLSANNFQLTGFLKKLRTRRERTAHNGNRVDIDNNILNNIISENGSQMDYQASSPDEKALVEAAARFGVTFLGEDGNNLLVKVGDDTEIYERLQVIEFTSERKRMSVVVRDKDGKIYLFCKGAESSVFPLCKNSAMVDETDKDINAFASKGLRTLALAFREVPDDEFLRISDSIRRLDGSSALGLAAVSQQYRALERSLTLVGGSGVEDCLQDGVADTLAALRQAGINTWVLTGDKVETAINVAKSCAHISDNDRCMSIIGVDDESSIGAHFKECRRILAEPTYRDFTLIVDGGSMSHILDTPRAGTFADISLKCNAVLCCRLSPIQKAKIVKLIKQSPRKPITAAIGDGANDISMIQEAHVGFGIFGKEGHQAARSADFAFTKFSMVKKMLLVMGHWYYQRLATLIHYFFYKNLVLGNIMLFFQISSLFSTQSIYDSMYLTYFNLVFTAVPCLLLSVTEQRWPADLLLKSFSATLFHLTVLITNLKIWLQARYHTLVFVISVVCSVLVYVAFNTVYSIVNWQVDGDILGTYTRLLASPAFWFLNLLVVVATLLPDYCVRVVSDKWGRRQVVHNATDVFTTRL